MQRNDYVQRELVEFGAANLGRSETSNLMRKKQTKKCSFMSKLIRYIFVLSIITNNLNECL